MQKEIEIKWATPSFEELDLNKNVVFSLVSDKNEQASPVFGCKAYVQDILFGKISKTDRSYYSLEQEIQPSIKIMRLLVGKKHTTEEEMGLKDFLHQIEEKLKITKTRFLKIKNSKSKNFFLLLGSKCWMNSIVMISMYTLLIRVGFSHKKGTPFMETLKNYPNDTTDGIYLRSGGLTGIEKIIEKIIEKGHKLFFGKTPEDIKENYPKDYIYCHAYGIQMWGGVPGSLSGGAEIGILSYRAYQALLPARWFI